MIVTHLKRRTIRLYPVESPDSINTSSTAPSWIKPFLLYPSEAHRPEGGASR
jgi:hypothetical protein